MIRFARPEDCSALGKLHVLAWQQAYEDVLPRSYLDSLDPGRRADRWRRILERSGDGPTVLLDVTNRGQLAGFASFGGCRDDDAQQTWGELEALYYLKPFWGSGRAATLWGAAKRKLSDANYSVVTLWVLRDNLRAISFYCKHGFAFDGKERVEQRREARLAERRMVLRVT